MTHYSHDWHNNFIRYINVEGTDTILHVSHHGKKKQAIIIPLSKHELTHTPIHHILLSGIAMSFSGSFLLSQIMNDAFSITIGVLSLPMTIATSYFTNKLFVVEKDFTIGGEEKDKIGLHDPRKLPELSFSEEILQYRDREIIDLYRETVSPGSGRDIPQEVETMLQERNIMDTLTTDDNDEHVDMNNETKSNDEMTKSI